MAMMDAVNEIVEKHIVPGVVDNFFKQSPFLTMVAWYGIMPGVKELMLLRFPDFHEKYVIVRPSGRLKIMDIKTRRVAHHPNRLFRIAQRKGTPEYQLARLLAP